MDVILWLIPFCVFWIVGGMYLGGGPIQIEGGGGLRQTGGLLVTFALFMAVALYLRSFLDAALPLFFALVISILVSVALLPVVSRVGFRILGVRIHHEEKARGAH